MSSILTSIKLKIDLPESVTSFDDVIIDHINNALSNARMLGVGKPEVPLIISSKSDEWETYFDNSTVEQLELLSMVKSFIYYSVKLAFDPPQQTNHLEVIKELRDEVTWKINAAVEGGLSSES